jgi:hypothetical protein
MIVGLVGRRGAGKDSAALILMERKGYEQLSFATAIKLVCKEVFALNRDQINGSLKEVPDSRFHGWTPRFMFQMVGESAGRQGNFQWAGEYESDLREAFIRHRLIPSKTVWVDHLLSKIQDYDNVVVTDVRHYNEAHALSSLGAHLIKIVRPRPLDLIDEHASEQEVDNILVDDVIHNTQDVVELQKALLRSLKLG